MELQIKGYCGLMTFAVCIVLTYGFTTPDGNLVKQKSNSSDLSRFIHLSDIISKLLKGTLLRTSMNCDNKLDNSIRLIKCVMENILFKESGEFASIEGDETYMGNDQESAVRIGPHPSGTLRAAEKRDSVRGSVFSKSFIRTVTNEEVEIPEEIGEVFRMCLDFESD